MIKRCDGCQREIDELADSVTVERDAPTVTLTRDPHLPPMGRRLHWCRDCAICAITALTDRNS